MKISQWTLKSFPVKVSRDLKGEGIGDEIKRDVAGRELDMMDELEDREIDMITISQTAPLRSQSSGSRHLIRTKRNQNV